MQLSTITAAIAALDEYAGRVCVASNLAAAIEAIKPFKGVPVCVVFGIEERASENLAGEGNGPLHRVTVTLKLLTAARDVADPHGHAAYAQADSARAALLPALLSIVPDTHYAPLEYKSGSIVYAEAGTLLWLDAFATAYYLHPPCAEATP